MQFWELDRCLRRRRWRLKEEVVFLRSRVFFSLQFFLFSESTFFLAFHAARSTLLVAIRLRQSLGNKIFFLRLLFDY
jgi:hypothetical protein